MISFELITIYDDTQKPLVLVYIHCRSETGNDYIKVASYESTFDQACIIQTYQIEDFKVLKIQLL